MRYDVKKFLFIGLTEEKDAFFQKAQEAGIIHFIEKAKTLKGDLPNDINNIISAIKVLRGLPVMHQEELQEMSLADGLVTKILALKHDIEKLHEEERILDLEIERVAVFGNFSLEDIAFIEKEGKRKVQFFFAKHGILESQNLPEDVVLVGSEHNLDYFVSISEQPRQYDKLIEMRIEHPVGELHRRRFKVIKDLHDTETRLKSYSKYNRFLHHALINKLNNYHLYTAKNAVEPQLDDSLFVIEGWVPVNKLDQLYKLVEEMHVQIEEIAIESTDSIPTYLENKGASRVGEDLVHIYDTPSPTDKDPSIWVLVAFSLFFAFIIGDGGYGLVFLLIALFIRYRNPVLGGLKKRVWKLLMILALSSIAWGFLTTSFFGIPFSLDSPIRKVSLITWLAKKKAAYHIDHKDDVYEFWTKKYPNIANETDPLLWLEKAEDKNGAKEIFDKFSNSIMMELALFIGCIHILVAMIRYLPKNLTFLGWIPFIIGGYLYIPHFLKSASIIHFVFGLDPEQAARGGLYLLTGGITLAIIISIFKNKLLGLTEAMTSIQIFADILSYLRLYALGLAGSIVTSVINETVMSINFVLAALLFVVGHLINLVLSVMGGIIHGLRLNFLEWYHYSFEGGGKQFKPLEKMKIE